MHSRWDRVRHGKNISNRSLRPDLHPDLRGQPVHRHFLTWLRLAGRQGWRAILLAGAVLSLIPAPARGIFEIVVESTPSFLLAAIARVLGGVFLRDNYMAYPVCAAVLALARISLSTWSRRDTALLV
jgi:hypothetical protein